MHVFNHSTWEAEAGLSLCEFQDSQGYIVQSLSQQQQNARNKNAYEDAEKGSFCTFGGSKLEKSVSRPAETMRRLIPAPEILLSGTHMKKLKSTR